MNIFVTDESPEVSAQALDNRRVIKMILETAQLLSSALAASGVYSKHLYKVTHKNHPCTLWAGRSRGNFEWLFNHGLALCDEYTYRYGKVHASYKVIILAGLLLPGELTGNRTEFANCTPYKDMPVIPAYRRYMVDKWQAGADWGRRGKPEWYN